MNRGAAGFSRYQGLTFLIGLGFFTMGLMDPLYDTFVPQFLEDFLDSKGLIGLIMTLDNGFALFMIPLVAHLSDNTRTRIGRRMPYILVTLPLSGILFAAIPFATAAGLIALIVVLFFLNIFKQAARGPVVALMPDTIPGEYRSEANGVINTMGAIAAILGTVALGPLVGISVNLPIIGDSERKIPFLIAGILVVVVTIVLFLLVKEKQRASDAEEKREPLVRSLKLIAGAQDRSALWVLVSIFFWFLAYQGLLPFLGLYTKEIIGTSESLTSLSAGAVGVAYGVFAIPSGFLAHKIGRKKVIRYGLAIAAGLLVLVYLHAQIVIPSGAPFAIVLGSFWLLLFLFGTVWGGVITNSFPMLLQMATFSNMGIYTGLYYFFSQGAAIVSPPIAGAIIDFAGYPATFVYAGVCMLIAFTTMGRVTSGEAGDPALQDTPDNEWDS
ncbi:MAG: MFS transporter [Spirochaetota bacterium]